MIRNEQMSALEIREFIRTWDAAGLDGIDPVKVAMDRRDSVEREFADIRNRGTDVVDIATKVVDGLSLREALDEWAGIAGAFSDIRSGEHIARINVLRDKVRYLCLERARTWLAENVDTMFEDLDAAIDDVDARLDKLRPRLEGIGSAEDAARAGGPAAKAWIEQHDLGDRRSRLGAVRPALGRLGLPQETAAVK